MTAGGSFEEKETEGTEEGALRPPERRSADILSAS
jgi:hypothetical protein